MEPAQTQDANAITPGDPARPRSALHPMSWPHGAQWEWAIGEIAVLGFLFWELYSLRRTRRRDRHKAARTEGDEEKG
jgi:hypothetical protein